MSRESDLYKDKIEVSLDGRQIFYLFFGGAVIVGLVFVLGVMVGRRVEARGHVERAQTQAAVDPLAALDRLESGGGLSFQGSLRGADAPVAAVDKTIGELAKQRDVKPAKPDKKVEPVRQPEPEKKVEPVKQPEPEKKLEPDKKADATAKKLEPAKEIEPEKKADAPKKATAPAKIADADKPAAKPADDKPDKKAAHSFTLQLSSFQDKGEAEAYLAQVKSNGLGAYLTQGDVDGKTYYRIRYGNYRTVDAANDAKADVERITKKSTSAVRL